MNRERAAARELGAQRLALDERHCIVWNAVQLTGREHGDDLRLLQARGELDLAAEAVDVDASDEVRRQHFDHDLPPERGLLGHEHACHPAAAELAFERVGGAEGGLEVVAEVGHVVWREARGDR